MTRVLALAPIALLVACGCTRALRSGEPPPGSVTLATPRWTVVPLEAGDRPDLLVVDWSAHAPAARRYDWVEGRALVLAAAPREASFRVFRRAHLEWLAPRDLEGSPRQQVVAFLGGVARDVDVRYARVRLRAAEVAADRGLAERLQAGAVGLADTGALVTR